MNDEMRELRVIMTALANQAGLLQWVNCYAFGRNEGGAYVSLFNAKLQYRLCTVYEERFRELPAFIRDNLPEDLDGVEISTDRTVLERKGILRPCTPFQIARYSVGDGDKAAWRFSGTVRVAREQAPQAAQAPAPPAMPAFENMADAIKYGQTRGAFPSYEVSKAAYESLKAIKKPSSAQAMYAAWFEHVEGILSVETKLHATQRVPGVAERVRTSPGYAG